MTDLYDDREITLSFDPLRGRNAELTAGDTDGQYIPTELTRERALALADALLVFACTPDPGPGAPYPLWLPRLTRPGGDSMWDGYHDIGYSEYAVTIMGNLEGARS